MVGVGVRVRLTLTLTPTPTPTITLTLTLTLTLTKTLKLNPNLLSYWECCRNMVRTKNRGPVRVRTHDPPNTVASNMVTVSHALNSATIQFFFLEDIIL